MAIMSQRVDWVLDADIRSFFDSVDHEWLMRMMSHRMPTPGPSGWPGCGSKPEFSIAANDTIRTGAHRKGRGSVRCWPTSSYITSSTSGSIIDDETGLGRDARLNSDDPSDGDRDILSDPPVGKRGVGDDEVGRHGAASPARMAAR